MASESTKTGRKARWLRRVAAMVCVLSLTYAIVAAGSSMAIYFNWITHLEVVAVASVSTLVILAFWVAFTLMFGRVYCSVICPMGVVMDLCARLPRLGRRAIIKKPYHYERPNNQLRYTWLALVTATIFFGTLVAAILTDPTTAYITIISNLADIAAGRELILGTLYGAATAAVTLIIVAGVSAVSGRMICNTYCPLGSILSLASRYSLYGIDINTDTCIGCNRCVDVCKSHCINPQDHTVDNSRCVICFNCIDSCPNASINYTSSRHRLSTPLIIPSGKPSASSSLETTAIKPQENETVSRPS
ncbi:MAG: 4Fe-4S binding protein [Muribaculaceae bacterium]|nr:4Fe-4S binding protein [Muribaculaceae bacterium]